MALQMPPLSGFISMIASIQFNFNDFDYVFSYYRYHVNGGVEVWRMAIQNRGTLTLHTPSGPGFQSVVLHFFSSASDASAA